MARNVSELEKELSLTKQKLTESEAKLERVKLTVKKLIEQMKEQA